MPGDPVVHYRVLKYTEKGSPMLTVGVGKQGKSVTGNIFMNYRRQDEPWFSTALFLRLKEDFDVDDIFMDVEGNIRPGDDFEKVLRELVAEADVMLAIIGAEWLKLLVDRDFEADFVQIEIRAAIDQKKKMIPVLIESTPMPLGSVLPRWMRPLTRAQAIRIRHEHFNGDCTRLVDVLKHDLEQAEKIRIEGAAAQINSGDIDTRTRAWIDLQLKEKGFSQAAMARYLGRNRSVATQILQGRRKITRAEVEQLERWFGSRAPV